MTIASARISSRYQVVIPKEVRDALHIQPQDTLLFLIDGDAVHIRPRPASFTQRLLGLHKHLWEQLPRNWLDEERAGWDG